MCLKLTIFLCCQLRKMQEKLVRMQAEIDSKKPQLIQNGDLKSQDVQFFFLFIFQIHFVTWYVLVSFLIQCCTFCCFVFFVTFSVWSEMNYKFCSVYTMQVICPQDQFVQYVGYSMKKMYSFVCGGWERGYFCFYFSA